MKDIGINEKIENINNCLHSYININKKGIVENKYSNYLIKKDYGRNFFINSYKTKGKINLLEPLNIFFDCKYNFTSKKLDNKRCLSLKTRCEKSKYINKNNSIESNNYIKNNAIKVLNNITDKENPNISNKILLNLNNKNSNYNNKINVFNNKKVIDKKYIINNNIIFKNQVFNSLDLNRFSSYKYKFFNKNKNYNSCLETECVPNIINNNALSKNLKKHCKLGSITNSYNFNKDENILNNNFSNSNNYYNTNIRKNSISLKPLVTIKNNKIKSVYFYD